MTVEKMAQRIVEAVETIGGGVSFAEIMNAVGKEASGDPAAISVCAVGKAIWTFPCLDRVATSQGAGTWGGLVGEVT